MSEDPSALTELRIILWNVAWRRAASSGGQAIRALIAAHDPDVICLPEAHRELPEGGYLIASDPDHGMPVKDGRHKVVLWSRHPWHCVDLLGNSGLPPGRFVRGKTTTPLGPLAIIGVCIPWDRAHVVGGRRDSQPWQQHRLYLEALHELLRHGQPENLVLLGDFNQAVPRRRAPLAVHKCLMASLAPNLRIATAGEMPGFEMPAIDHLACSSDLVATQIMALPNVDAMGKRISDHVGMLIKLARLPT